MHFLVIKRVVHPIHAVYGPFNRAAAEARARELAELDIDGRHTYEVCPIAPEGLGGAVARFAQADLFEEPREGVVLVSARTVPAEAE